MAKDPAVLIYFDKWISSTNGMKAEYRAWYFDLLVYQYDKGGIPDDEDEMAGICRVRPSEYNLFKQMVQQVLKQKFEQIDGKWYNPLMTEILQKRKDFKEKRQKSGNIGVIIKMATSIEGFGKYLNKLKTELYKMEFNEIEKHKDKNLLKHLLKLYIDEDVNEDVDIDNNTSVLGIKKLMPPNKKMTFSEIKKYFIGIKYENQEDDFKERYTSKEYLSYCDFLKLFLDYEEQIDQKDFPKIKFYKERIYGKFKNEEIILGIEKMLSLSISTGTVIGLRLIDCIGWVKPKEDPNAIKTKPNNGVMTAEQIKKLHDEYK